mgnify:CR=1 FL=1
MSAADILADMSNLVGIFFEKRWKSSETDKKHKNAKMSAAESAADILADIF